MLACLFTNITHAHVCTYRPYRALFRDDDTAISRKMLKVLKEGLNPVLCIGETKEEYEAGLNHEVRLLYSKFIGVFAPGILTARVYVHGRCALSRS